MWSDRLPEERRRRLAGRLRAVLPAPAPHARGAVTPLRAQGPRGAATPEQVAEEMRGEPGFIWLDGPVASGHRFFARPLDARRPRRPGFGEGPGGRATFAASGFDLLDAAFAAWGDAGVGATLAGYLGYEMGGELESLPPPARTISSLPDLHLSLYDAALRWDGRSWTWKPPTPGASRELRTG